VMKKLFVFSGLAALVGIVSTGIGAGCATGTGFDDSFPADAHTERRTPFVPLDDEPVDAGSCPEPVPFTATDFTWDPGYKSPKSPTAACTDADISKIAANIQSPATSYLDFVRGVTADCKSCAVANWNDSNWAPLVLFQTDGSKGIIDFGACFGVLEGEACG